MTWPLAGPDTRLGDLGHRPPVSVPVDATLQEAATAMQVHNVSSVLVGEKPGLITERDLARAYHLGRSPGSCVTEVETAAPLTATWDTTLLDGTRLMLRHHVRHLVVLGHHDEVIAVVSLRATARVLARNLDPATWSCLLDATDQLS